MFSLHGIGVGGGIVIGRARRLEASERDVPRYRVCEDQIERELARLETAIEVVRAELQAIAEQLPEEGPAEARALLDVHAMILDDPALVDAASTRSVVGPPAPAGSSTSRAITADASQPPAARAPASTAEPRT